MAIIRPGIYLIDNPPRRRQHRNGRRSKPRPVIVVHTAESGTDRAGPDPKAENVAQFIRNRTTPGSYHLIGDADSIIQLVRFEDEAFHDGTGSNQWAIGISLAMNADDWPTLPEARVAELIDTAGQMAAIAARWFVAQGLEAPAAVRLTKAQSDRADASGFIDHGRRDPRRRRDPGAGFPWHKFFESYRAHLAGVPTPEGATAVNQNVKKWQEAVGGLAIDGEFGPRTLARSFEVLAEATRKRVEPAPVDPVIVAKAALWDRYRAVRLAQAELEAEAVRR